MLKVKIDQCWPINKYYAVVRCGNNIILTDSSFNKLITTDSLYGGDSTKMRVCVNYDDDNIAVTFRYDQYYSYSFRNFAEFPYHDFNYHIGTAQGYLFKIPYINHVPYHIIRTISSNGLLLSDILDRDIIYWIQLYIVMLIGKNINSYELVEL